MVLDVGKAVLEANSFEQFNEMQQACLERGFDSSMVVSAPTASGKTIVAELYMLEQAFNNRRKVIYTCPLRALASEHYYDFKKKYPALKFALSTGDIDSSSSYLKRFDVIFCTYEKLASLLRHNADWLSQVGCLIVDEIHELDSDRGPVLEVGMTQLRNILPELKILGLSATIPNSKELAKWLEAELVESSFRPVKLKEGVMYNKDIEFNDGTGGEGDMDAVIENAFKEDKQLLMFLNSRKRAEGTAKKLCISFPPILNDKEKAKLNKISEEVLGVLEQPTEQCQSLADTIKKGLAFHHAGLMQKQRSLVEENFRAGLIKLISATPTLAAGVNTPADIVLIPSLYRFEKYGMNLISKREYKQMCFVKGTGISLEAGEAPIESINRGRNIFVKSFNESNSLVEDKKVVKSFKRKVSSTLKLKFSNFVELECTPNHEFCVFENGIFSWKLAKNLNVKDKVIVRKEISKNQKNIFFFDLLPSNSFILDNGKLISICCNKLGINEKQLSERLKLDYKRMYHIKNNLKAMPLSMFIYIVSQLNISPLEISGLLKKVKSKSGKPIIISPQLTTDFLWLVGLIATDGNINKQSKNGVKFTKIRIFNLNKKIIANAKRVLMSFGIIPSESVRDDGNVTLEFGGTLLGEILINHFGLFSGNKTSRVRVPTMLFSLKPQLIGAYLAGVFDGDGNYSKVKQLRGIKSFSNRILIVTASKDFAKGLSKLFSKIGIVVSVTETNPKPAVIRGDKIKFSKKTYNIIFRKIEYIKKFSKYAKPLKAKFNVSYSKYNNLEKKDYSNKLFDFVSLRSAKLFNAPQTVYNLSVIDNNNYFAEDILVHNCGRSGRPKFSTEGTSIVQANSEMQRELYMEDYINGNMESITSRLGIIPILRTHILALIATNHIYDLKSAEQFFEKTLYATQFQEMDELLEKVMEIMDSLESFGFIEKKDEKYIATKIGKRVSDLFLDPESAYALIQALSSEKPFSQISYLFAWTNCLEFFPWLRVPKKVEPLIWEEFNSRAYELPFKQEKLLFEPEGLNKFFSALMLEQWINEKREQELFTEFGVAPGVLFGKNRIIEWLSYATIELSKVLGLEHHLIPANKLSKRVKYGVKEELLPLVELKGIGRARARKLYKAGITRPSEVKKNMHKVESLLGKKVSLTLAKQLL